VDYGDMSTWSFLLTRMEDESHARRHFWREFGDTVLVWHFGEFVYDDQGIDDMMERAAGHKNLIIDLRNNGGGSEEAITRLIGHFIDHPQRVARLPRRNKTDSLVAKPRGKAPYHGNVVVLLNANSASASEVTARFLQLEGYATVVGDRSMGAVKSANIFAHDVGFQKYITFGLEVTVQDVVMNDGAHLENTGVMPEWIIVPTGADLAARRDPQMTKALALAGIQIDPAQAAKIYSKDFARAP
jgi:C-terminal processing protease CtpA/Prc